MSPTVTQLTTDQVISGWPYPAADSDKYSRGVVGFDTGSQRYPGAAILGVTGALFSGAGMIRYFGTANPDLILARMPSVTIGDGQIDALVVGSGWDDRSPDDLGDLIGRDLPMVLDAGALTALKQLSVEALPQGCLLTPHAGELAQLIDVERADVERDPVEAALTAARRHGAAVLIKGRNQYCVTANGEVVQAVPGPSWTGQAGSGDVLAGICGTLLATGLPALQAGGLAASIQAMAAQRRPGPFPPDVLAHTVAEILGAQTQ